MAAIVAVVVGVSTLRSNSERQQPMPSCTAAHHRSEYVKPPNWPFDMTRMIPTENGLMALLHDPDLSRGYGINGTVPSEIGQLH